MQHRTCTRTRTHHRTRTRTTAHIAHALDRRLSFEDHHQRTSASRGRRTTWISSRRRRRDSSACSSSPATTNTTPRTGTVRRFSQQRHDTTHDTARTHHTRHRTHAHTRRDTVHREIAEFCSTFDNLHFLQMSSVLLEDNGSPATQLRYAVSCVVQDVSCVSCRVVACRAGRSCRACRVNELGLNNTQGTRCAFLVPLCGTTARRRISIRSRAP